MIYKFKTGSFKGLDAQAAGDELERIRKTEGGMLPTQKVWQSAMAEQSPLHNAFTWDVQKAAEERWADQARALIRAVVVVQGDAQTSAFINVSVKSSDVDEDAATIHYYQAVQVLAGNPKEYESALALSKSRLTAAQNGLQELLGLATRQDKPRIRRARKHVQSAVQQLTV